MRNETTEKEMTMSEDTKADEKATKEKQAEEADLDQEVGVPSSEGTEPPPIPKSDP